MTGIWLQAQTVDTVKYYYSDTLKYVTIIRNDTTFGYTAKGELYYKLITKGESRYYYNVINEVITPSFSVVVTHGSALLNDGRCNGIKSDGTRCTRTVKSGVYYCWQHKP